MFDDFNIDNLIGNEKNLFNFFDLFGFPPFNYGGSGCLQEYFLLSYLKPLFKFTQFLSGSKRKCSTDLLNKIYQYSKSMVKQRERQYWLQWGWHNFLKYNCHKNRLARRVLRVGRPHEGHVDYLKCWSDNFRLNINLRREKGSCKMWKGAACIRQKRIEKAFLPGDNNYDYCYRKGFRKHILKLD